MATLIPEDLDLSGLHPESERRVIRELLLRLGDDWQIIPKVGILVGNKNAEIDIVLASRHRGVFVLEVKGGIIAVRNGQWYSNNEKLKTDPFPFDLKNIDLSGQIGAPRPVSQETLGK